jgi:hypothetical protein
MKLISIEKFPVLLKIVVAAVGAYGIQPCVAKFFPMR